MKKESAAAVVTPLEAPSVQQATPGPVVPGLSDAVALPDPVARRGISEFHWRTLCNTLFPGADPKSVLLVWDYCQARGLDPMKKPCHIVPMEVKDVRTGVYAWRDVVLPGIYEYRTTAHRTGLYLGHTEPVYGPDVEFKGLKVPEWCAMTVFRAVGVSAGPRAEFPVRTYFREVVAVTKDKQSGEWVPNARWKRAPIQMLTKCTEAGGLREAFPEEFGGEPTAEEIEGQRPIHVAVESGAPESPAVVRFKELPEALRDRIEQVMTSLRLTDGQRLVKITEYLGVPGAGDLEGEALLKWCHEELVERAKLTPPLARGQSGEDAPPEAPSPTKEAADGEFTF